VLGEQAVQQSHFRLAATGIAARVSYFATAGRFASSGAGGFAATSGLDIAAGVTVVATQLVKQAKRAGVDRARGDHCDRHQSRNDYTTHRDISMDTVSREGFAWPEPRHVRAAMKTGSEQWLDPIANPFFHVTYSRN
jgi:hypothetical protein